MTEQTDFLERAVDALIAGDDTAELATNSEYYAETYMQRRREWFDSAQMFALLSLAQDVRRVADALDAMQSTAALRVDLLS